MIRSTSRRLRRLAVSAVEFAFVAPVFLLILFGILEYARFLFALQVMNNAVREGARYAIVNTATATKASVQSYVDTYLAGQGGQLVNYNSSTSISIYQPDSTTGLNTGTDWQNTTWGSSVGVSVSGTYKPIVPGFIYLTGSLSITASCVMTTEAN